MRDVTPERDNFQVPLDEVDAAARILDPVMVGFNTSVKTGTLWFGKLFKDYEESDW